MIWFELLPYDLRQYFSQTYLSPYLFLLWKQFKPVAKFIDIRENDTLCHRKFVKYCASQGYVSILEWWKQQFFTTTEQKYSKRYIWHLDVCGTAAYHGHKDVITWAMNNGCEFTLTVCEKAAAGGHLDLLQWARNQNMPWSANTCQAASAAGHLEVLKWARFAQVAVLFLDY